MSSRIPLAEIDEQPAQISTFPQNASTSSKKQKTNQCWQMARFVIVGGTNTIIDLCVLNILLWFFPTRETTMMLMFNSLAYTIGAVNSFLLNKYWTFRQKGRTTLREISRFAFITIASVLCSDALLWGADMLLQPIITNQTIQTNIAKLVAVLGMAMVSYFGMRLWVFVRVPYASHSTYRKQGKSMQLHHPSSSHPAFSAQSERQPFQGERPVVQRNEPTLTQSISIVLPAHNEEANIARTILQAIQFLRQWAHEFEVVVVNDGSTDTTGAILTDLQQREPYIRVITHPVNRGYGAALSSGFEAASKELVFFMDSDGQFDIADIRHFFAYIETYDAVIGYRVNRQDSRMRRLNAWGWKTLVWLILGVQVRDIDCAFKLFHSDFLHRHHLETKGAMINAEILYKIKRDGGTVKEVGVQHLPRRAGQATGANVKVIMRAFRELWTYARRWKREEHQEFE